MQFPLPVPAGREFDVVGFGENTIDYLIVAPHFPAFDTKVRFEEYTQTAGGRVASALVGLQRLGLSTAYAGRFGTDAEGSFGLQSLKSEGVNTDFAQHIEGAQTRTSFIVINAHTGERTILWNLDERLTYMAHEAPLGLVKRGRVLHLDATDAAASLAMARAAKQSGTLVSANINQTFNGTGDLLPLVDILITSRDFSLQHTNHTNERAALKELNARYHCPLVCMTRSARDALALCGGEYFETPALPIPDTHTTDTTGAGDAFHTGFLYALLRGENIQTTLKLASAIAALKCRELGARRGLPSQIELKKFMGEQLINENEV
ncbi:MAG: carbohydrate kinase family protein [Pyrinomonadaceae bacterium]